MMVKQQWWVISSTDMLDALRRVANGEDPDLVYAELYANAQQESWTLEQ